LKPDRHPCRNARKVPLLAAPASTTSQAADDREARIQALLGTLRVQAEPRLRQLAERLVDLPAGQAFGQLEHDLGDLGRGIAASAHQAGLDAGTKGAT
jgi:hypothetical protein